MIDKEVAEIRRRLKYEKNNITHILGCYVNERKEIISTFSKSMSMMKEDEIGMYLSLLRRSVSGSVGKNLMNMEFSTAQVVDSEEHKLLMNIKKSEAKDETFTDELFEKIISNIVIEGNFLVLLALDKYDVPYRGKDNIKLEDASNEMFTYYLCCVCPVKQGKPVLGYDKENSTFTNTAGVYSVSPAVLGFMFPSFADRTTNIYSSLYYLKDLNEPQDSLTDIIFGVSTPMPATVQKEVFSVVLSESLENECEYDVIQTVHEKLSELVETHKVNKEVEPLYVSKDQISTILDDCGVTEDKIDSFNGKFETEFGIGAKLMPANIIDVNQFEVKIPDIVIKVKPEKSTLIETKVIDGKKYLLIRADDGVEVNGVNINVNEEIDTSEEDNT